MTNEEGGLDDARLLRYSRHILLEQLGVEAQETLLASHALIIGIGGLGTPAAMYLAAAGVGRLTLVDGDSVDLTNLQRQILFQLDDIGKPKAGAAKHRLAQLNPEVKVAALDIRADATALDNLIARADVVLDCSDNFATRHAINRACVRHQRVLVSGAAIRFHGQLSVFDLRQPGTPCYACLFADKPAADEENCATMGVFAPLTGMIGSLQAGEALKCLVHVGQSFSGRLLLYDALNSHTQTIAFGRDPSCSVCSH